jgi:hypothetical protein
MVCFKQPGKILYTPQEALEKLFIEEQILAALQL